MVFLVQAIHPGCVTGACMHIEADDLTHLAHNVVVELPALVGPVLSGPSEGGHQLPFMPLMMVMAFLYYSKMLMV